MPPNESKGAPEGAVDFKFASNVIDSQENVQQDPVGIAFGGQGKQVVRNRAEIAQSGSVADIPLGGNVSYIHGARPAEAPNDPLQERLSAFEIPEGQTESIDPTQPTEVGSMYDLPESESIDPTRPVEISSVYDLPDTESIDPTRPPESQPSPFDLPESESIDPTMPPAGPETTPALESPLSTEAQELKSKVEGTLRAIDLKNLYRGGYLTNEQYDDFTELKLALDDGRIDTYVRGWAEVDAASGNSDNANAVDGWLSEIAAIAVAAETAEHATASGSAPVPTEVATGAPASSEVAGVSGELLSPDAQALKEHVERTLAGCDIDKMYVHGYLSTADFNHYTQYKQAIESGSLGSWALNLANLDQSHGDTRNADLVKEEFANLDRVVANYRSVSHEDVAAPSDSVKSSVERERRQKVETYITKKVDGYLASRMNRAIAWSIMKPGEVRESRKSDEIAREQAALEQMDAIVDGLLGDRPDLPAMPAINENTVPEAPTPENQPETPMTLAQFETARYTAVSFGDYREAIRLIGEYLQGEEGMKMSEDGKSKLFDKMAEYAEKARAGDRSTIVHAPVKPNVTYQPTPAEQENVDLFKKEQEVKAEYDTVRDELQILVHHLPNNSPYKQAYQVDNGFQRFEAKLLERILEQMAPNPDLIKAQRQVGEALKTEVKRIKDKGFAPEDSRYSEEQRTYKSNQTSEKFISLDIKKRTDKLPGIGLEIQRSGRDYELLKDPELEWKVEYLDRLIKAIPSSRLQTGSGPMSRLYAELNPRGMDVKLYALNRARVELKFHGNEPAKKILSKHFDSLIGAAVENVGSVTANKLDPRNQAKASTQASSENRAQGSKPASKANPVATPKNRAMRANEI